MYAQKIGIYQGDCKILLGRHDMFSQYIEEFSKTVKGNGLDVATGPGGCNAKFFTHCNLDGCDIEQEVLDSLPTNYSKRFLHNLSKDIFPYEDNSLDFVICSCVLQHLNNFEEVIFAITECVRILKPEGKLYLMFKCGAQDQFLTHYNEYYKEERTFRVFSPEYINFFPIESKELLLDDNWIPYCKMILVK